MPDPTVEQLMNMDTVPVHQPSAFGPILAFFFLPPFGVYLFWKEKSFHKTFALLTTILGVINFLSGVSIYLSVPKFGILLSGQGIKTNSDTTFIFYYIVISLVQIVLGYFLWKNAKIKGYLETWQLTVLSVLTILVDFVILPLLIGGYVINTLLPIFQQNLDPYKDFPASN